MVRKTVTVLFADVTGSTGMGEQLDPEALRRVMTRYFAVSRATLSPAVDLTSFPADGWPELGGRASDEPGPVNRFVRAAAFP